jgi:hypothetical protein
MTSVLEKEEIMLASEGGAELDCESLSLDSKLLKSYFLQPGVFRYMPIITALERLRQED